jgi:hypothetical protein
MNAMKKIVMLVFLLIATGVVRAQSSVGLSGSSGVYPHPSAATAYLDIYSDREDKEAKLSITNLLGEPISTKNVEIAKGKNVVSFEREQLATGIYLVTFSSGREQITRRFTVSR